VEFVVAAVVLVVLVGLTVGLPLMREATREHAEDHRRAALEAAKEAKYREIRDAELDYRMGKLTDEDWTASDRELRAQAIEILRALDQLDAKSESSTL
jgi:hypothetical protein